MGSERASGESFFCCGVRIASLDTHQAVAELGKRGRSGTTGHDVHLCNAFTLSLAARESSFQTLLNGAALNLADGTPVAWTGRLLGHADLRGPVRGMQLMIDVMRDGVSWGARHYLYGSSAETMNLLGQRLSEQIPGLIIVGMTAPPFRDLTTDEELQMLETVVLAAPHFVWVGLGTPKQDLFVAKWVDSLKSVLVPVGAAFDFAAGTRAQAPPWLQGSGLEWVYRLLQEPRRLWRRYLIGNTVFLWAAVKDYRQRRTCA